LSCLKARKERGTGLLFDQLISLFQCLLHAAQLFLGGEKLMNLLKEILELVRHFRLLEKFTSAQEECLKFDMVWLYPSPIPVGRRGVISSFK
jgi:hypothetical protein